MELNDAINHLKESLACPTHKWGCDECKAEHEQLLKWIEDYKQLKADYADLDNRLRTANTENDELRYELKRANEIIRYQKEEFDRLSQMYNQFVQAVAEKTLFEPVNLVIDEETAKRLKLIGDDNNAGND